MTTLFTLHFDHIAPIDVVTCWHPYAFAHARLHPSLTYPEVHFYVF